MGINRYPGPKPFKEEEESIFFGRDVDIQEFYKYLFLHQTVVLFGESGYGKSSLINAGIIPLLKIKNPHTVCFEIKFGPYVWGSKRNTPIEKTKEIICEKLLKTVPLFQEPDSLKKQSLEIRYKNFLLAYEALQNNSILLDNYLKTDRSFWYYLKNFQMIYETQQFIFFFDQFEELFTYPPELIFDFKKELSDVLYSIVPEFYRNQEERLDQEGVSEEFRMAFYQKPDVKIVFSIRSDRLSLLEDMKDYHPAVLKNCYELRALDTDSALETIHKPAGLPDKPKGTFKTVPFKIEDKLALAIVHSLQDKNQRVQPSTLQIICWRIEDKFIPPVDLENEAEDYKLLFDEFDENKDGNIKEEIAGVFNNYYRSAIETKVPEPSQNAAFLLVEKVLVQSGQRIPFERDYLLAEILMKQFKIPDKAQAQTVLDMLTEASLLKVERDTQGRMLYELGHDTLVEPISKAAALRKEKEDQQRQLEEAKVAKKAVLKAIEKEEKARQQANEFRQLKEAAEAAKDKADELARKAALRSQIAIFVSVIALCVAMLALYFKRQADEATSLEKAASASSVKAEKAAYVSRNEAQKRLRDFYVLQAKGYIEKGDELVDRKAYLAALDYYEAVLKLPYQDVELQQQINTRIRACKIFIKS